MAFSVYVCMAAAIVHTSLLAIPHSKATTFCQLTVVNESLQILYDHYGNYFAPCVSPRGRTRGLISDALDVIIIDGSEQQPKILVLIIRVRLSVIIGLLTFVTVCLPP